MITTGGPPPSACSSICFWISSGIGSARQLAPRAGAGPARAWGGAQAEDPPAEPRANPPEPRGAALRRLLLLHPQPAELVAGRTVVDGARGVAHAILLVSVSHRGRIAPAVPSPLPATAAPRTTVPAPASARAAGSAPPPPPPPAARRGGGGGA